MCAFSLFEVVWFHVLYGVLRTGSSEAFSEFGGSASFGFAEKAVEMADGIESARKAYFGDGMFGLEQHTCRNAKTIINEIAIWSASCFVFKET